MNSYAGFIGELFGGFFHGGGWGTPAHIIVRLQSYGWIENRE
ncbi:hypothetical protein J788_1683 [Acinetobacter baumannii 44895_5]|nr:hypothetical protein J788_1683 [Acinetobacter baumannii 44895_5]